MRILTSKKSIYVFDLFDTRSLAMGISLRVAFVVPQLLALSALSFSLIEGSTVDG